MKDTDYKQKLSSDVHDILKVESIRHVGVFYIYNGVAAKFTNVETRNSAFSVLNATLKKNDFNLISGLLMNQNSAHCILKR